MPIGKELEHKLNLANHLYHQGFKRVRFTYLTIGFKYPVGTDLIWLDKDKEPILAANVTNISRLEDIRDSILEIFTMTGTKNNSYGLEFLGTTTLEELNSGIKNMTKNKLGNRLFDDTLLISETDGMEKLRTLFSLKDNSRNGIMENFSYLAKVAKARQDLSVQDSGILELAETFKGAVKRFDAGDNKWCALGEYIINYLSDYDLAELSIQGLATLLGFSPKEQEYVLYYEFTNTLLELETDIQVYIPFLGDNIYAYSYCSLLKPLSLVGYVNTEAEKQWSETLFSLTGTPCEIKIKEPEQIIMETPTPVDHIFLLPPYGEYVRDISTLSNFKVYQLTKRREEKLETLALEHSLNTLKPYGKLFALLSHSFISISPYDPFRKYLLEKANVKAIVSFPPGIMQKRWGYQLDFLYFQKKHPDYVEPKPYLRHLTEYNRELLKSTAKSILRGDQDDRSV